MPNGIVHIRNAQRFPQSHTRDKGATSLVKNSFLVGILALGFAEKFALICVEFATKMLLSSARVSEELGL